MTTPPAPHLPTVPTTVRLQPNELEAVEDFRHHRHHDKAREIVMGPKGYPDAEIVEDGVRVIIQNGNIAISQPCDTLEEAWASALFQLTQLNAWLLWKAAGEPEGEAVAEWLDAQGNLQNQPSSPLPPPTE